MKRVFSAVRVSLRQKMVLGALTLVVLGAIVGGTIWFQPSIAADAASGCSYYTVNFGDTLGAIAATHHSTVNTLARVNHIFNPDLIFPGQRFCIPTSHVSSRGGGGGSGLARSPVHGGSVESMIYQVFGSYGWSAVRVARCESGLNPYAYNPYSIYGSHAMGVFQILYPSTWSGTSEAYSSPYNTWANIVAAHNIFVRDGYSWREWSCQPYIY